MGLSSDIRLRPRPSSISSRHNNISNPHGSPQRTRNRRGMLATGCGATKICLQRNKSALCKMIRHSAACRRNDSRFFGSDCSISKTCHRNSSCAY